MQTRRFATLLTLSSLAAGLAASLAATPDSRCYEMRTYYAAPGKLDALQARFRDNTVKLFEKHGMVNIGYWVPQENPESKLIYILAHTDRDAAQKSWRAFSADPEWKNAYQASEVNGRLVTKADVLFLKATDYSPAIKPATGAAPRAFELRVYTASPGNLGHLNARFRDHTLTLFEKHGIANVGYWTPMPDQKGASDTLVYLIAHVSREAAEASFKAFRADPAWMAARQASEEKAGGSLTVTNGVKSTFMTATDYSAIK